MKRNFALDLTKVLLAVMVVGIHTAPFSGMSTGLDFFTRNGVFHLAVPLFFMVTGYYFISIDSFARFKKWFSHIVILYVFWMLVYLPFYMPGYNLSAMQVSGYSLFITVVLGYFHLWYVAATIVAGLILYFMRGWKVGRLATIGLVLYSAGVALQYLAYYRYPSISFYKYQNFLFLALPFMMAGLAVAKSDLLAIKNKFVLYALAAGLLCFAVEILLASRVTAADRGFDMYFSRFFIAPALFTLIIKSDLTYPRIDIALLPSVIYFTHIWFFLGLGLIAGWHTGITLFLCTLIATLITYGLLRRLSPKLKIIF
jgi:hypothetical protein